MRPSPRPGLPGGKANAPSGNPASAGFLFSCFRRHCRARAAEGYTAPYAGPAPCGKRCSQPRPPPQDAGNPPEGSPPDPRPSGVPPGLPGSPKQEYPPPGIALGCGPYLFRAATSARRRPAPNPPGKNKKKALSAFSSEKRGKGGMAALPRKKALPDRRSGSLSPVPHRRGTKLFPFLRKKTLSAVSCSRCYTIFFSPGASLQESRATESAARGLQPQTGRHE